MSSEPGTICFQALCAPKHGNSAAEYEDACAANLALGRFAVADGATESAFAAQWARLLVDGFVSQHNADPCQWSAWLPGLQTRWEQEIGGQSLPWYGEMQREQGAFATFLGVTVQPPRWHALAVGDSCLFHIHQGQLAAAFPLRRAADFVDTPWLLGSRGLPPTHLPLRQGHGEGLFAPGDRLWLMTDALAKWFLEAVETGQRPWDLLEPLLHSPLATELFLSWMTSLRANRQIRNDDVTLLGVWCAAD